MDSPCGENPEFDAPRVYTSTWETTRTNQSSLLREEMRKRKIKWKLLGILELGCWEETSYGTGPHLAKVKSILMSIPTTDINSSPVKSSWWVYSTYPSGKKQKSTTKASWKSLKMVCPTHSFRKHANKQDCIGKGVLAVVP